MAVENILIKFLLLLALLFFVPRLIEKFVPHPITEVVLGILLGLLAPSYFAHEDIVVVLSALGIITLFVYAGLEADVTFIRKHKRVFIENVLLSTAVFVFIAAIIYTTTQLSLQVSLLISLALTTPSASFILSVTHALSAVERQWIEGKALAAEISAILIMAVILGLSDWKHLALVIAVLGALLLIVPALLHVLYKHLFSKLVGTEFSFILVIALLSAFVTESIGLHFLVGAFFAGFVAKQFITTIVQDKQYKTITKEKAKGIIASFGFFAATFTPFFFFSTGLDIPVQSLTWTVLVVALFAFIAVSIVRITSTALHRRIRVDEKAKSTVRISTMLLPPLVFTFVIAEILYANNYIEATMFATLMLYGLLASLIPVLVTRWLPK